MDRFILSFALFLLTTFVSLFGQSPYQLDWKKESAIGVLGLGTMGSSFLLDDNVAIYTQQQLTSLNRSRINAFDRVATYNYSLSAQKTSDYLSLGSKLLPLVLLIDKNQRNDFMTIATLYAETFLVANSLTAITKTGFQRTRPFVYNEEVEASEKLTPNARYSFISGHTSKTAAMTFFTAKVFADYHPDSKWKPVVWTAAAVVPAVTGYMRVRGGKHFPTDVLAGYAVGALTGILVPQLHKSKLIKNKNVHLNVGLTGANLSLVF